MAEAFRFVLGEQSIKSLRGKRGEDLIFNGSIEAGRLNRASVKLVFDNIARTFPLDFDEVTIERVVHRDSVNEYFINGSSVRLKDVAELLASAHIGASGHHIISQGEADRILNANPKERRDMIEDALGLKIYQYKKTESERKLEKTRENMERVASLRREIAPHIRFLKKQVEKIEKGRQLREELIALYSTYFAHEDAYIAFEKKRIADELSAPTAELARLTTELEAVRTTIATSKQEDPRVSELEQLEQQLRSVEQASRADILDIGRIEGEIASIERLIKKQEEAAERAVHDDSLRTVPFAEVKKLSQDVTTFIDDVFSRDQKGDIDAMSWRESFQKLSAFIHDFVARHSGVRGSTQTFVVTDSSYAHDIAELQAKKITIEKARDARIQERDDLQSKRALVVQAIEDSKAETMEAERAVFAIMSRQNELHSTIGALKAREDCLTLEDEDYHRELNEAAVVAGIRAIHFEKIEISGMRDESVRTVFEDRTAQHERRRTIEKMKIRLEEMGGGGGEDVVKEYTDAEERDAFLARELQDLEQASTALTQLITELDEKLNSEFRIGIQKINAEFQNFFALMFGGGHASLSLVKEEKRRKKSAFGEDDEIDDATDKADEKQVKEGIDIAVNLPNKKVKALMMLSGGERSLTSVALLFALSQVNPPPFIILDETDAALDEANSRKYGDMIETLSKLSQLIVITHNRETMSRAGVIYGVTMQQGASKLLSIRFDEAVAVAK